MRLAAALLLAFMGTAQASDWREVDGDTIRNVVTGEKIRAMGVDAPELHARCPAELELAQAAKKFTADALDRGVVELERHGRDKYGRVLAIVRVNGVDLALLLIERGLGRQYNGGRRMPWC